MELETSRNDSGSRKATVLIVDDIPENIDILRGVLEDTYSLKAATGGERAIHITRQSVPDLILLDIMMPEMDGFMVCQLLKEDPRTASVPVIFVTALDDQVDESRGFELGAVDYITKPVNPDIVRARVKTHLALYSQNRALEQLVSARTSELQETRLEIIRRLGRAAEFKDNETGMHVIRMSKYSQIIALGKGLEEREAELVMNASPMHDVGKIGIPDGILLKNGPLDDNEWEIMKTHPEIGGRIIGEHSSKILTLARVAALTHHEKFNGKGYPAGLAGTDIPLVGRIVAVADVFDALTSKRPYKEAWEVDDAIDLIKKERGEHFDPELVDVFTGKISQVLEIKESYSDEKAG